MRVSPWYKHAMELLLLLLVLQHSCEQCAATISPTPPASSTTQWQGPEVLLRPSTSGIGASLTISGKQAPPLWIGGCTGIDCAGSGTWDTRWSNWNFSVSQAGRAGFAPLVEVELPPYQWYKLPIVPSVNAIIEKTLASSPTDTHIVLRLYFDAKPQDQFENITVMYSNGTIAQPTCAGGGCPARATISPEWIADTAAKLGELLLALDARFPGKIAAVRLGHLAGEEWTYPHPDLPGPLGASDYSQTTRMRFCRDPSRREGSCSLPTFVERAAPTFGNTLRAGHSASQEFERFLGHSVADAIIALAREAKRVSSGKLGVWTYYGYYLAQSEYGLLGRGGHAAGLSRVLEEPSVDALSDAFMYSRACRDVRGAVLPDTLVDTLRANDKVFILEDDTRTSLNTIQRQRSNQCCQNMWQDLQTYRRNHFSLALRGSATYLLSICLGGWWGRVDVPKAQTQRYWDNFMHIQETIQKVQLNLDGGRSRKIAVATRPQIAVFVDESSLLRLTMLGAPGNWTPGDDHSLLNLLIKHPYYELARIGTPVRYYLLSDLLLPSFDTTAIKLAIFFNAFVTSNQTQAAMAKLKGDGRTLVYNYAPGLLNENDGSGGDADINAVRAMVGVRELQLLPVQTLGSARVKFVPEVPHLSGLVYGLVPHVSPRLTWSPTVDYLDGMNVTVLGEYEDGSGAALVHAQQRSYSTVITPPGLPAAGWRYLAEQAGVHFYTSSSAMNASNGKGNECIADVCSGTHIESGGGGLLVHVTNAADSVQVRLPQAAVVIDDAGDVLCDRHAPCESFSTGVIGAGEAKFFVLSDTRSDEIE